MIKGKKYPILLTKKSKGIRKKRNITQEYVTKEIQKDTKRLISKVMDK